MEHTLCLEQLHNCLFQPLYTCTQTNLRMTYSGQTRGWSESILILTNESWANITRLICVDQSQGLKSAKERERIEMKNAPLLCRAALKIRSGVRKKLGGKTKSAFRLISNPMVYNSLIMYIKLKLTFINLYNKQAGNCISCEVTKEF